MLESWAVNLNEHCILIQDQKRLIKFLAIEFFDKTIFESAQNIVIKVKTNFSLLMQKPGGDFTHICISHKEKERKKERKKQL